MKQYNTNVCVNEQLKSVKEARYDLGYRADVAQMNGEIDTNAYFIEISISCVVGRQLCLGN